MVQTGSSKKYRTGVTQVINWGEIKILGKTASECCDAVQHMTSFVYRSLTYKDVCAMASERLHGDNVPLEMVPGAPKKPFSAYNLFTDKQMKKLKKKNPEQKIGDLSRIIAKKWKTLDPSKKDKYVQQYKDRQTVYDTASRKLEVKQIKDKLTPYDVFSWSDGHSNSDCKAAYRALGEKEILRWIWKAVEECQKRKLACDKDEKAPLLELKDFERKILYKSEGIDEKPAKTLQSFYRKNKRFHSGNENLGALNTEYKSLTEKQKENLSIIFARELDQYVTNLTNYLERRSGTLVEDEDQNWQVQILTYQKVLRQIKAANFKREQKTQVKPQPLPSVSSLPSVSTPRKRKASPSPSSSSDSDSDSSSSEDKQEPVKKESSPSKKKINKVAVKKPKVEQKSESDESSDSSDEE